MINIVCCIDHNFVLATTVMLCSLCKNAKQGGLAIHIICDKTVNEDDKDIIKNQILSFQDFVSFYEIKKNVLEKYPQSETLSESAYYRLFIQEILPANIDKVLYLDGDIIVRGDISELWDIDINNYSIGAVTDFTGGKIEYYNRLGYSFKYGYFNSGVLLINLKKWREEDFANRCRDYIYRNYKKIKYHDQDVLNALLINDIVWLPLKYNFQNGFLYKKEYAMYDYSGLQDQIEKYKQTPLIVHFTSADKPWFKGCRNPYSKEFTQYKEQTMFKDVQLKRRKTTIKGQLIKLMQSISILPHNPEYIVI